MTHRRRRSNARSAAVSLVGSLAVGAACALTWLAVRGPGVTVDVKGLLQAHADLSSASSVFAHGGAVTAGVAVAAFAASLLLFAAQRLASFLLRVVLLAAGLYSIALGGYLVYVAVHDSSGGAGQHSALARALQHLVLADNASAVQLRPGVGAYLALAGGVLLAIGSIMPGRLRQTTRVAPSAADPAQDPR